MRMMRYYRDIETGEIITSKTLYREWIMNNGKAGNGDNVTFSEYCKLCTVSENGTLEEIEMGENENGY